MPLNWTQVKAGLDPTRYTIRTVPALIAKSTAWEDYFDAAKPLKAAIKRLGREGRSSSRSTPICCHARHNGGNRRLKKCRGL
jgi:hypothetical protein